MEEKHKPSDYDRIKQGTRPLFEHLLIRRKPRPIGARRSVYDSFFKPCLTTRLDGVQQDPKNPTSAPQGFRTFVLSVRIIGYYFTFNQLVPYCTVLSSTVWSDLLSTLLVPSLISSSCNVSIERPARERNAKATSPWEHNNNEIYVLK